VTAVELQGIKLTPCVDYLASLPDPTCVARVDLAPFGGPCLVHLDLGICFVLLKKLMGGRAESEERVRAFTEIERGLFTDQLARVVEIYRRACSKLVDIEASVQSVENNPNYLTGMPNGEALVCFQFNLALESVAGPLEIVIPLPGFEPVRTHFDPEQARELRSPGQLRRDRALILDALRETTSELVVKLATTDLSLAEVLDLREGDQLRLPQPVSAPLVVELGGNIIYTGIAGRVGSRRAVKLTSKISQE
jgi:flagellar motor switch protein FliM